jgi:hypothetical protein
MAAFNEMEQQFGTQAVTEKFMPETAPEVGILNQARYLGQDKVLPPDLYRSQNRF